MSLKTESFNGWGGRGCRKFVPVLAEDGTKIAPPRDIFDQSPGEMSQIRGKLTDYVEDHAVTSPEIFGAPPFTDGRTRFPAPSLHAISTALQLLS